MPSSGRGRFDASPQAFWLCVYLFAVVAVLVAALFWAFPDTRGLLSDDQPPDVVAVDPAREVVGSVDTTGGALAGLNRAAGSADTSGATPEGSALGAGLDSVAPAPAVAADPAAVGRPLPTEVSNRRLLFLVILIGAIGASLHGLTSLVEYVGNDKFVATWTLWYLSRPAVGALLAVVFYFVSRGLVDVVDTKDEFYGVLAVAGLIGLFSKQALYKLSEVFDVIFKSEKDKDLKDKLAPGAAPTIRRTAPASFAVGAADRSLQVTGTGFVEGAVVRVGARALDTTFGDAGTLTATLDAADLAAPGELAVTVANPAPGGTSAPFSVEVEPAPAPDPAAPASDTATGPAAAPGATAAPNSGDDSDSDAASGSVSDLGSGPAAPGSSAATSSAAADTVADAKAGTGTPGPAASTSAPPTG